jgi:hypothetical protein
VKSNANGYISTLGVPFTAKIEVTDFQPRSGSLYGGTLLTITGAHFSDVITDNPVKVGYEYITGVDHYCYVQETSETQIKCRIAEDYNRIAQDQEVIVFASTFEEATHADPTQRDFTFMAAGLLPTLTSVSADFTFSTSDKYKLTLVGTQIADTATDTVEVFVGGIK